METEAIRLKKSIYWTLAFVGILWTVKIFEVTFDYDLGVYGILPRSLKGSLGIITGPLVHGDIYHLLSNTFPIIILGIGIIYFYKQIALEVIALIYLMTGFWVWVAARDAYHIGASGLVYGFLAFLLISGFIRRDTKTLSISFIVLFLYGGSIFSGFAPTSDSVSWESHILGAMAGLFCAIYFRNVPITSFIDVFKDKYGPSSESDAPQMWNQYSSGNMNFVYQVKEKPQDGKKDTNPVYTITILPSVPEDEDTSGESDEN